jgi:hypothetical protein
MAMPKQQWNIIEAFEAEYTRKAVEALKNEQWAKPLVDIINKYGITETTRHRAFEARFGYAIYLAGLTPELDFMTGVDDSDVEYLIPGNPEILAELVCTDEIPAINENTVLTPLEQGMFLREVQLSSKSDDKYMQPGGEVSLFKRKLMKKVLSGKVKKFPLPSDRLQIIVVNDKGLSDGLLIEHQIQAMYGTGPLKRNGYMTWAATLDGEFVAGLLESDEVGAKLIQERIHAVGVMTEYELTGGEYAARLDFFVNPALIDIDTFQRQWSLSQVVETRVFGPDSKFELESRPGWEEIPLARPKS